MSNRLIFSAVALMLATAPALPAVAQSVHETHTEATGATAGRSPHKALRQVAAQGCRETAMHSLPAGKPHSYGTHALRGDCAPGQLALTKPATTAVHAPD